MFIYITLHFKMVSLIYLTCLLSTGAVRREMTTVARRAMTKRRMVKWRKWTLAMMAGRVSSSPHAGDPYPKSRPIRMTPTSRPTISPQNAPCRDSSQEMMVLWNFSRHEVLVVVVVVVVVGSSSLAGVMGEGLTIHPPLALCFLKWRSARAHDFQVFVVVAHTGISLQWISGISEPLWPSVA